MHQELSGFLDTAVSAARIAGDIIMKSLGSISSSDIVAKKPYDFVTTVDKESEREIIRIIGNQYPKHHIIGEESLRDEGSDGYRWIIDPLDGTTNFIHEYPVFSVSIALEFKKSLLIGVVLDPSRDDLFVARKGCGAFLNGRKLQTSAISEASRALVCTGFPFRQKALTDKYLDLFRNVFSHVSDIRRAGSAALDLAYLAAGRCEGFFELALSPWDLAAGSLIVEEAGGIVTDFQGGNDFLGTGNVIAGNTYIHPLILSEARKVFTSA